MTDEHVHINQQRLEVKVHCPKFVDVVNIHCVCCLPYCQQILYIIASIIYRLFSFHALSKYILYGKSTSTVCIECDVVRISLNKF